MSNSKNVEKLIEFAEILTMIFSTGHKMPITHQGIYGWIISYIIF
jgi:hypothetical protein